jgi:site-specific recombinase XerD
MDQSSFVSLDKIAGAELGPLAKHLDAYIAVVREQGYLPATARKHVRLIAKFSQWLRKRKCEAHDLDESVVERFLRKLQDARQIERDDAATLIRLLRVLRQQSATPQNRQPTPSPQEQIVARYRRYLVEERGLSSATARNYLPHIDRFLSERFWQGRLDFAKLRAPDVTSFLQQQVSNVRAGHDGKVLVTALRSFLGHLRHQGEVRTDLAACVPGVANWSSASLPRFIPAASVQKVLDSCERQTPTGRRNYAILLLLARLGLRAGEVAGLNLEDIEWDNARITVRAKGGRWSQLPLPRDAGKAIADYLRSGRPLCSCRRVFIRDRAPLVGFGNSTAISMLVTRALQKAGVDSICKGAHLFRHSLATDMLRQGASLGEIGDLLGHKSLNTTAIYAKVDLAALRPLALPWPGGVR